MHLPLAIAFVSILTIASTSPVASAAQDESWPQRIKEYENTYKTVLEDRLQEAETFGQHHCTSKNARVRRSWDDLSLDERKTYINAVKCLQNKKSVTPESIAPGARSRLDDFTVTHVNQTLFIHFSGWLMPWHRYFLWQHETALREECGYEGAQPYWEWTRHNDDWNKSPLLDGSEYSLGGNGLYVPHGTVNATIPGVPSKPRIVSPPGTGGGCVVDGPFANMTHNLGPFFPDGDTNPETLLNYRPHCMTRDFLNSFSEQVLTPTTVGELLTSQDQAEFRRRLDETVHPGGHSSVGQIDVFGSPQDPVFYFHHAQLDRLWAIWQHQDIQNRLYQTSDTKTYVNSPPSPNATITDTLDFGFVGGQVMMSTIQDSIQGPLCYRYE